MIPTGQDSLNTRSTLEAGGKTYAYYSLAKASQALGDVSRLPFSMKVLLENLLRFEDGVTVTRDDLQCMADWLKERGLQPSALNSLKFTLAHPVIVLDRLTAPLYERWQIMTGKYGITTYVARKDA